MKNGKHLVTDGPFAETREQLGGYTLIEATDLDDAIAIASGFFADGDAALSESRGSADRRRTGGVKKWVGQDG